MRKQLISFGQNGWPQKSKIEGHVKKFYSVAAELSVEQGLLLRGSRFVIPLSLQPEMLKRIHEGHQGIVKCRERAQQTVWWPGLNSQLQDRVFNCTVCPRPEPLCPTPFPERAWQNLGVDFFDWKYLLY